MLSDPEWVLLLAGDGSAPTASVTATSVAIPGQASLSSATGLLCGFSQANVPQTSALLVVRDPAVQPSLVNASWGRKLIGDCVPGASCALG